MEVLMGLDHLLREKGIRNRTTLHYISDQVRPFPPVVPKVWDYLYYQLTKRSINVHLAVLLVTLDHKRLDL